MFIGFLSTTALAEKDTVWKSSDFDGTIQIDKTFRYVGSKDKSNKYIERKYYVYDAGNGTIFYVLEIKLKGSRTWAADYDPVLGRAQNPTDPLLIAHQPNDYAVWKDMSKDTYRTLKSMKVKLPKCRIITQRAEISPSRKSGFWATLITPSTCKNSQAEIDEALNTYNKLMKVNY
jgi:hypothetical protein